MGTLILSVYSPLIHLSVHLFIHALYFYQCLKIDVGASAIELLEIMLEETHEKSQSLAQGISDDLDVRAILSAMLKLDEMSEHKVKLSILYIYLIVIITTLSVFKYIII